MCVPFMSHTQDYSQASGSGEGVYFKRILLKRHSSLQMALQLLRAAVRTLFSIQYATAVQADFVNVLCVLRVIWDVGSPGRLRKSPTPRRRSACQA